MQKVESLMRACLNAALDDHAPTAPLVAYAKIVRSPVKLPARLVVVCADGSHYGEPLMPSDLLAYCRLYRVGAPEHLARLLSRSLNAAYYELLTERIEALQMSDAKGVDRSRQLAALRIRLNFSGAFQRWRLRHHEVFRFVPSDGSAFLLHWWAGTWRTFYALSDRAKPRAIKRWVRSEQRGFDLLEENLTRQQLEQYAEHGFFEVVGGASGKRYRINHGTTMNIQRLTKKGRVSGVLCFLPRGGLVTGDVMLAQKSALELFETHALSIAFRY